MRRREFLVFLVGAAATLSPAVYAQQPMPPVIGVLHSLSAGRSTAVLAALSPLRSVARPGRRSRRPQGRCDLDWRWHRADSRGQTRDLYDPNRLFYRR